MFLSPYKAIIFDLDGLILDTEPTYGRAWKQAARELGFELDDALCQQLKGCHLEAVQNRLRTAFGTGFDIPAFHELSTRYWHQWVENHGIAVKPGYRKLMDFLHASGTAYALATNSRRRYAEKCMKLAGILEDFPLSVARDEVAVGKPAPDIYERAADILQQPAADCLAIEDSAPGILSAHRAGTRPVLIPDATPVADEIQALAVAEFSSLDDFVSQLIAVTP